MMSAIRHSVAVCVLLGVLGCGPTPGPAPSSNTTPASSTAKTTPPSAPEKTSDKKDEKTDDKAVTLEVVKLDDILARIDKQKGKIVVLDTWATWCVPCVKEFHELVELHERHAKDGVVCMSVTLDEVKAKDKALEFLKKKNAAFGNFIIDAPADDEVWQNKWNIKSIPVVLVFDQSGKLAKKFDKDDPDKQFTYRDVEKFVQGLLSRAEK